MCVRTKTSYGCGHEFKSTVECHVSRCPGLERYHYPKIGDCRDCKRGGSNVTRGRDGKGRYAIEISRRDSTEEEIEVVAHDSDDSSPSTTSNDMSGGGGPWAIPSRKEKPWNSPARLQADEAWEVEHEKRIEDLQKRSERISPSSHSHEAPATGPAMARQHSHRHHHDEAVDLHDDYERPHHRDARGSPVRMQLRNIDDDHHSRRPRRPTHHRTRNDSYESFDSMHSSKSSVRRYKICPTSNVNYDQYEYRDSGYGSYSSRTSHGYGAKTEPYMTSPSKKSTSRQPATSYGAYETGFGVGLGVGNNVHIISREPLYQYSSSGHGRRH